MTESDDASAVETDMVSHGVGGIKWQWPRYQEGLRFPIATVAMLRGLLVSILSYGRVLTSTTVSWNFSSVLGFWTFAAAAVAAACRVVTQIDGPQVLVFSEEQGAEQGLVLHLTTK